jgi:hypothetical protein
MLGLAFRQSFAETLGRVCHDVKANAKCYHSSSCRQGIYMCLASAPNCKHAKVLPRSPRAEVGNMPSLTRFVTGFPVLACLLRDPP